MSELPPLNVGDVAVAAGLNEADGRYVVLFALVLVLTLFESVAVHEGPAARLASPLLEVGDEPQWKLLNRNADHWFARILDLGGRRI